MAARSAVPTRPFLKWAGGKSQLLDQFVRLYPERGRFHRYLEPFVGSGAVFFHVKAVLAPKSAILADSNEELVNVYTAVRDDVDGVVRRLRLHARHHGRDHYYEVRGKDPSRLSPAARAARFVYLNKTCFNGLYRVNSRGQFNVPMGRYEDPPILDEANLRAGSAALRRVTVKRFDFEETLSYAKPDDFIYFDPPYHPLSETSYFTAYTKGAFGASDQEQLAAVFRELHRRGCRLMLSNSETSLIRRLYTGFRIEQVSARRNINSRGDRRGRITEVVVMNYEPPGDRVAVVAPARRTGRTGRVPTSDSPLAL